MSQPALRLAACVYATADGPDLVILDVARDAYFCLPDAARGLRLRLGAQDLVGLDAGLGADLQAAGLATATDQARRAGLVFTPPTRDLFGCPRVRPSCAETLGFVWTLVTSGLAFHRQTFARMIASISDRPILDLGAAAARIERRALAFRALLPWSPVQGACLFQALWLRLYLRQAGLDAAWVFGVRTWPFSAHCWLQSGDLVLNDTAERVAAYRPILVA
jgi:hypothetical protein